MVTYGLRISVRLRLWGMSVIILLMMCETREVVIDIIQNIDWNLVSDIFTVMDFFTNCILDISTLEMRVLCLL